MNKFRTNSRNKSLESMIEERTEKLNRFLSRYLPEATWMGDVNAPCIVLGKRVLSCYLKNFTIVIMDRSKDGNELVRFRLDQNLSKKELKDLTMWSEKPEFHREIYRVKVKDTPLYLSGYNFLDKSDPENPTNRYPVFAPFQPKIYFSEEMAQSIVESYKSYVKLEVE
jgi:hypothetical protein